MVASAALLVADLRVYCCTSLLYAPARLSAVRLGWSGQYPGHDASECQERGAERQFADVLGLCYHYTSLYGKEIVVAECGYAGDPTYIGHWANAITKKDPRFPLLSSVVYFDDVESVPWPGSGDLPDWRVG